MTYDTAQLNVSEIRKMLVSDFGYDEEEMAATKGKKVLVQMLADAIQEADMAEEIDFGDDESTGDFEEVVEASEMPDIPCIGDYEWSDYVLEQFQNDELIKGNPTVDGMRRVVERIISPIRSIITNVVAAPEQYQGSDQKNDRRATVVVTLVFDNECSFDGAADVYWGNTDKVFRNYPVSVAETRAEGRALKRALRLRKVNAAEELADEVEHDLSYTEDAPHDETGPITKTQVMFIDVLCKQDRLNLNTIKLVESLGMSIGTLTHEDARALTTRLNELQNTKDDISEELLGYDSNWQNSLGVIK